MLNKNTKITVVNRSNGRVGYTIKEMNVRRQFSKRESKEIPFGELQALSYESGGLPLLKHYLIVRSEEALKELGLEVQPEYFYSEEDIKDLLLNGSLDALLDCLDFAPDGVIEMVKKLAVSLPVNSVDKRDAILKKLNFNVTKAIEIQNTKFDGDTEADEAPEAAAPPTRRITAPAQQRRVEPPKYKVVKE